MLIVNEWILGSPSIDKCEIYFPYFPVLDIKLMHSNSVILSFYSWPLRGCQFLLHWFHLTTPKYGSNCSDQRVSPNYQGLKQREESVKSGSDF